MKQSKDQYQRMYQQLSPPSPSYKTVPAAFLFGGAICALGQWLSTLYQKAGLSQSGAATAVSCTLIALGVALTAARLFEKIAKVAGAGTLVPITGFANSIAAPALEFQTEGLIPGTCVKMFTIAGPVLTCAMFSAVVYGVILVIFG